MTLHPATTPQPLAVSLIQMAMSSDRQKNLERACELVERAARMGADIVVLPELFQTPYFCVESSCGIDYQEDRSGESMKRLSRIARKLSIVLVAGSFYDRDGFNTSLVFDTDGSLCGTYEKSHIPQDPGFHEKEYFRPGTTGIMVIPTSKIRLSVLICFDQWFPEAARIAALSGAELLVYPTAIGNVDQCGQPEGNWHDAWETVQRGHAIANCLPIAVANRVGTEGSSHFWGGSFVCDAFGKILSKGGAGEEIVTASIDRAHGPMVQREWGFLRNRRPDLYGALIEDVKKDTDEDGDSSR